MINYKLKFVKKYLKYYLFFFIFFYVIISVSSQEKHFNNKSLNEILSSIQISKQNNNTEKTYSLYLDYLDKLKFEYFFSKKFTKKEFLKNKSLVLLEIVRTGFNLFKYEEIIDYANKGIEFSKDKNEILEYKLWLGKCYTQLNEPKKSNEYIYECLRILYKANKNKIKLHPYYITLKCEIATNAVQLGEFELAKNIHEECLNILDERYPENHLDFAVHYLGLATIYSDFGNCNKSEELHQKALDIYNYNLGTNNLFYTRALNSMAINFSACGNALKAKELFSEVLEINKILYGEESEAYVHSLVNIGTNNLEFGEFISSIELLDKALKLVLKISGDDNLLYAQILSASASAYSKLGDLKKAIELVESSLLITQNHFGENHPDCAIALSNLAGYYYSLGIYSKAEQNFHDALDIIENNHGKYSDKYVTVNGNFSLLFTKSLKYKDALEMNLESKIILDSISKNNSPKYQSVFSRISKNYYYLGNLDSAIYYCEKAINISKNFYGKGSFQYANELHQLGFYLNKIGNTVESISTLNKSLEIKKDIFSPNHFSILKTKRLLGSIYRQNKMFKLSDSLIHEVFTNNEKYFNNNLIDLGSKEKELYIGKFIVEELNDYSSYFLDRISDNYNIDTSNFISTIINSWINVRSVILYDRVKTNHLIKQSNDSLLTQLNNKYISQKSQLGLLYEKSINEIEYENLRLSKKEDQLSNLELDINKLLSNFKEINKQYKWLDIRNKLKPNEAYLEIIKVVSSNKDTISIFDSSDQYTEEWQLNTSYLIIIIKNDQIVPEFVVLNNGNFLENEAYKYYLSHNAKKKRLDNFSYKHYWSKIDEKMTNINKIYVTLEGVFSEINLKTLYDVNTDVFLNDKFQIQYLFSSRDLLEKRNKSVDISKNSIALFGYPEFDLINPKNQQIINNEEDDLSLLSRGYKIKSLPGTFEEVLNIKNLAESNQWNVSLYTDLDATENNIKSINSPTVLHLATHGYRIDNQDIENSDKVVHGFDKKLFENNKNPLLKSGLYFAGASNTLNKEELNHENNGIFTAFEASNLSLNETELVVLSACETALGHYRLGEGVYGLPRSFIQSGAENIIMSIWEVGDRETEEFMSLFYKKLFNGNSIRGAFNSTQQMIKEKYKHPYYWGAFIMIGN